MALSPDQQAQVDQLLGVIYQSGFSDGVASVPPPVDVSKQIADAVAAEQSRIADALSVLLQGSESELNSKVAAIVQPPSA